MLYVLETDDGDKTLAELFDGRSQLLIYHFMFGFPFRGDEHNLCCTACSLSPITSTGVVPPSAATSAGGLEVSLGRSARE